MAQYRYFSARDGGRTATGDCASARPCAPWSPCWSPCGLRLVRRRAPAARTRVAAGSAERSEREPEPNGTSSLKDKTGQRGPCWYTLSLILYRLYHFIVDVDRTYIDTVGHLRGRLRPPRPPDILARSDSETCALVRHQPTISPPRHTSRTLPAQDPHHAAFRSHTTILLATSLPSSE